MNIVKNPPEGSQSIDRALGLLSLIASSGGDDVAMPVLTRKTGLSRPTVRRMLLALMRFGYVAQNAEGGYAPGPECLVLGAVAARRNTLLDLSMDSLILLAEECGDSSFVSIRRGSYAVCLHREEGRFPIRTHVLQPGARHPLGVGAGAMAILSALPDDEAHNIIDQTREERREKYPRFDDGFLKQEYARSRDRGWSLNPGMYVANSWAIGVPVRASGGQAVGSLSIAAIDSRMTADRRAGLVPLLSAEAARVEKRLEALTDRPSQLPAR